MLIKAKSWLDHAIISRKYAESTAHYRLRHEKGIEVNELSTAKEIIEILYEAQEEYIKEIRRLNSLIDILPEPKRPLHRRFISWCRRAIGAYEPMGAY